MIIAIQGVKGSFHDVAAQNMIGKDVEILPKNNFKEVFESVNGGESTHGLVAVENSLHGSINEVYRLLDQYQVWIIKDYRMRIDQHLISSIKQNLNTIKQAGKKIRIISHPVALAQVDGWLSQNLPNAVREERLDTASSVNEVVTNNDKNLLAIAGQNAVDIYGGVVIAERINDNPGNYTRFVLFQKTVKKSKKPKHSSVIIRTDHRPGALLSVLKIFEKNNINLTKLDSQPIPGDNRHYIFYIDYEVKGSINSELLQALKDINVSVKLIGEY